MKVWELFDLRVNNLIDSNNSRVGHKITLLGKTMLPLKGLNIFITFKERHLLLLFCS